ncbi:MAG: UDP-glucose 4-epimerase GalE [Bacillota bacterium]|nr:UDP-glucose 4-epimerase GalE [Bacillota bacterium]
MNILLTGGAGYIGSHTAIELISAGHSVVIADNLSNSKYECVKRVEKITGVKIPFYEVDVACYDSLKKVFEENKFDAAIHFAGYKAVGESVAKPAMYYRNNINTTLTLIDVMEEYGVKNLVFSSSATVYGVPEKVPLTEDMPTGCTNPYGWTKLMIEQILKDAWASRKELSVVLLRYFNPIGAHESGLIGEDPSGIPNNLMPYIAQVAVGKRDKLNIFGNDYPTKDGTGVRDYIHVVDLAKGHVAAINYSAKNNGVEIVNLGTGTGYSVLDIVNAFKEANSVDVPYVFAPRRPGDIATCYADPTKAEKVLGWKASKSLFDMCKDTWNWQSKNPDGFPSE